MILSIPDEGNYSRKVWCALFLISTFLLKQYYNKDVDYTRYHIQCVQHISRITLASSGTLKIKKKLESQVILKLFWSNKAEGPKKNSQKWIRSTKDLKKFTICSLFPEPSVVFCLLKKKFVKQFLGHLSLNDDDFILIFGV